MNPGLTVASEPIQISGGGAGGQGALQLLSGAGTWGGTITAAGDAQIANRSFNGDGNENLAISGRITGGSTSSTLTFRGSNSVPGFFRLTGAGSDYLGTTYVWGTKLILGGGDNTLPVTTVVDLDSLGRATNLDAGVLDLNGTNQTLAGLTNHAAATPARVVNRAAGTMRTLTINNTADFAFAGQINDDAGQLRLVKSGAGNQTLAGANSYTGGTNVTGGVLTVAHSAALGSGDASISGATLRFAPSLSSAAKLPSLTIAGTTDAWNGKVDLNNDALVIDYSSTSPLTTIQNQVKSGYASGAWNGNGINSSAAGSDAGYGLGFAEQTDLAVGTYAGQSLDATSLVIAYTRLGDSNLDRTINLTDFNNLSLHFGASSATWFAGDFNYDALVNLLDFNLLAANFGLSAGADGVVDPSDWAALASVVPEPGTLSIILAGAYALRRGTRRFTLR
jgi:autotransporter-associated beta strand protein